MDLPVASRAQDVAAKADGPSLLRFITCGSVDDGKSTLIGRLLHDTGSVPDDQLRVLSADSRRWGTQGNEIDYALLLDGLSAEREQGITIDVAYRYFSTARRSFIVADTPGHRQYTRNMATGASTAELAILLVDARKGIVNQTRRHSLIVSMLGVRHLVLAVNKMDLVDHDRAAFQAIVETFDEFAARLGFTSIVAIPMAARSGDNVAQPSKAMPWYDGPTLLSHLETVDIEEAGTDLPFRFPVQWVSRPTPQFRGYAGTIAAGTVRPGMAVTILPAGTPATIARIVKADGDPAEAAAGEAVIVTLAEDVDVARGDVLASAVQPSTVATALEAALLWTADEPLDPEREYLLKAGTATVPARIDAPRQGIDVETGALIVMTSLAKNEICKVGVQLGRPLAIDVYARSRGTGGFILIDRRSHETVAVGLVERLPRAEGETRRHQRWPALTGESPFRSLAKALSWRALGSFGTVLLAFAVTHSRSLAVVIGTGEVLTKVVLFFLHERVWARVSFGLDHRLLRARDMLRARD